MKIYHFKEVNSTNDEVKKLMLSEDRENWLIVYADHQTKGRGQRGNSWQSLPKRNLQMSFGFIPIDLKYNQLFRLNEWVSVTLFNLLHELALDKVSIKWPNDILVNGKKICGILIENGIGHQGVEESIIGIGLNVNQAPDLFNTTCIAQELGVELSVKNVLNKLIKHIELSLQDIRADYEAFRKVYLGNLHGYSQAVKVKVDHREVEASVNEVLPNGDIKLLIDGELLQFGFKEFEWIL
jgi:BirA family biotin operon repressor/biotin-[acetyl-CoA-carboxylase] ligase